MNKIIKVIHEDERTITCLLELGKNKEPIKAIWTKNEYKAQRIKEIIYDLLVDLRASKNEIKETLANLDELEGLAWERGNDEGASNPYC